MIVAIAQCRACRQVKPLTEFAKKKARKSGIDTRCKECATRYVTEWVQKNREKRNSIVRKSCAVIKSEMLDAYGGVCACCGEARYEFLGIDHIHGGGVEHRQKVLGSRGNGAAFYRWLKRQGWPKDDYRLLCHNCNLSLGLYGRCPHGHGLRGGLRRSGGLRKYPTELTAINPWEVNPAQNIIEALRQENAELRSVIARLEAGKHKTISRDRIAPLLPSIIRMEVG